MTKERMSRFGEAPGPKDRTRDGPPFASGRFAASDGLRWQPRPALLKLLRSTAKAERGGSRPDPEEAAAGAAERVAAVMRTAADKGLTRSKNGRIAGRVSPDLIERAKARTGLHSDTELVEFALASLALDDDFARVFREMKGTVDPDLDLAV